MSQKISRAAMIEEAEAELVRAILKLAELKSCQPAEPGNYVSATWTVGRRGRLPTSGKVRVEVTAEGQGNGAGKPPLAERVSAVQAGDLINLDDGELLDELRRIGYRRPPGQSRKATPEQIARHHEEVARRREERRRLDAEAPGPDAARWRS